MADHVDGDEAQPQPRHYPLDIPHLPFNRYDHRRLTARDLIVHRLMADFMKPSRVPAAVYDMTARCDFQIHDFSWYKSRQARHRFYGHDQELFKDVRTLNDLLITSSTKRTPTVCDAVDAGPGFPGPLKQDFDTVGEHVLDLVMRHYLETDDTALRVWLSRARPPRTAEGPLGAQFNPDPRPWTRMHRNVTFDLIIESQRNRDEKSGTPLPYLDHLLTFRPRVALQDKLPLYDGGAFIPALRQIMSRHAYGIHGARRRLDFSHWTVNDNPNASLVLPAWPERNPFSRILMHPRRWYRLFSPNHTLLQPPAPLDLSLQFGRGRNRDGIWATGWDEKRLRCKTGLSGLREGRYARLRRRCASEPPLGSFATAELPVSARWPSCICLQIMYPRMSILQLDKRARRRSLSRTHIEAMFDWNLEGLADASGVPSKPPPSAQADSKAKQRGRLLCENCRSASHHTSLCPSPCGYCGAPNPRAHESRDDTASFLSSPHGSLMPQVHHNPHLAPQCPVARHNRCKCVAFPTFHTAEQCTITCRRACGNPAPPGSFAHRNAMTCRARCCMCGLRNHSGRECRLQTCRCGGAHLGQDCRWNPTCRVPGCDRFLCGLHCRECGSAEKPFVGWRCWRCLGFERPPEPDGMARKGMRKGRVGEVGDGGGEAVAEGDVAEAADGNPVVPATVAPAILTAPSVPQLPPKAPESEREEPPNASQSIFGDPRTKDSSRSNR